MCALILTLTRAVLEIDVVQLGLNSPEIQKIIKGIYKAQKYLFEVLNERLIHKFSNAKKKIEFPSKNEVDKSSYKLRSIL